MPTLLERAARGESTERPPVWLMRQAGRYLPEYREIRDNYSFLEAIKTPEVAERISLLPYHEFDPDGVVMYSDILPVLEPLGLEYHLESGVGPVVDEPVQSPEDVPQGHRPVDDDLDYVGDLLSRLDQSLDPGTALIGFAGGPFTVASYAVAGRPSSKSSHRPLRRFRHQHPEAFEALLDRITDVVIDHLKFQVARGADVFQLFDTYAGVLPPDDYRDFILPRHRRVFDAIDAPGIVFVRDPTQKLELVADCGADAVSLGWSVDMANARRQLGDRPVQGNLDPTVLYADEDEIRRRVREIAAAAGDSGHIMNLGHGVPKDAPVEGVRAFVDAAKSINR